MLKPSSSHVIVDAGKPTFVKLLKDPILWTYTLLIILSLLQQVPLSKCTTVFGVDLCCVCNALTTVVGSVYAGNRFGDPRTGWLTFIVAAAAKVFSSIALPADALPSILVTSVVFVVNVAIHVLEVLGI